MRTPWDKQGGYASLLALWVLVVFGGIAVLVISLIQNETDLVAASTGRLIVEARVDGAIEAAIADLTAPDSRARVLSGGGSIPVVIGGRALEVGVVDSCGLVDLNTATEERLRALFVSLSVANAGRVLEALAAARALDGPFETTAQLRALPGLSLADANRISAHTTVFCRLGITDTAFAPRAVLESPPGMTEGLADRILKSRTGGIDPHPALTGSLPRTGAGPGTHGGCRLRTRTALAPG